MDDAEAGQKPDCHYPCLRFALATIHSLCDMLKLVLNFDGTLWKRWNKSMKQASRQGRATSK